MRKRLFAWMLERFNTRHNRDLEPYKRALFGGLRGRVVEIGAGGGVNLPFFSAEVDWTGIEPNLAFEPYFAAREREAAARTRLQMGDAQALPFDEDSVDAVVSTLVLCSVRDQSAVLGEVRRVLKPGGRFLFIEHVAAELGSAHRRRQQWIRPCCAWLGDGCDPLRDTGAAITAAGFSRVRQSRFYVPAIPIFPHIEGEAIK
ncbi:MAG: class I SAM-dependent methyltransferase [Bryobacteraceae bacterium]|nr:class I SAM-dependent methyltransferase [Bryobacteraceae bacterium]